MTNFTSYTMDNVPERSKEEFKKTVDKYGAEMNIFRDMAESPLPINIYQYAQELLNTQGTLNQEEVNLVQMAVSVENGCEFCVPAHTAAAKGMKTDDAVINAIRNGQDVPNNKFDALANLTRAIVRDRGYVNGSAELDQFLEVGYTKEQVFEIITIAAYKTITNYTSALAGTEPNEALQKFSWKPSDDQRKNVTNRKAA